ncbi:hypothetical protein BWZ20_05980 [Winogradskyella sp. J14-2]|uniref:hypothetical protein n=1 Tax=Winogradskyella sp. J14-2 TaxID=1936080 RepID=UPI0009729B48|nr:hypothetical protein [Winogradskyella sp. J14-2]APY07875.1 hypothetical protein BWZ20_05980 [Winogradskyella sp. J14-2]
MKKFIAYFDYLGYKEFIMNNDSEHHHIRVGHIQRDIESALAKGKYYHRAGQIINDVSESPLITVNISDTVLFWTKDDSIESFKELLEVCYEFNWSQNNWNFPIRGAIIYDEIYILDGKMKTKTGGYYNANTIYGKGIVNSHIKAESQNWAGTVIDNSIIEKIRSFNDIELLDFLKKFAIEYKVPYKHTTSNSDEYVLKLTSRETIDSDEFVVSVDNIIDVFKMDNKETNNPSVKSKIDNTIKFVNFLGDII